MEGAGSGSSSPDTDRDFDPSADMLVHDFDDEQTLEEEENMSGDSCSNELNDLEKEGEMPIEDLLAIYGYSENQDNQDNTRSSSEEEILSNHDLTLDKDEIARDVLKNNSDDDDKETTVTDLLESVTSSHTPRLLRSKVPHRSSVHDDDDVTDSEDDVDYHPIAEEDWKKTIQVGGDYQVKVPEGLCKYGDAPAYENEDRLLWDPSKLDGDKDNIIETYLKEVQKENLATATGVNSIPTGVHIKDDEQALYLLLQCGHNMDEALRRRKMSAVATSDPMSLWSEEECRNFENGIRTYGKNFYLIQQNKVRTRSVGELVQFYYLWKKTERHDAFANKTRLEKRKYALHPGVTDYMDRFLDDSTPPPRDRSDSPSLSSLVYGELKRSHIKQENETKSGGDVNIHVTATITASTNSDNSISSLSHKRSQSSETFVNGTLENVNVSSEPVVKKVKTESNVSDSKHSFPVSPAEHPADSLPVEATIENISAPNVGSLDLLVPENVLINKATPETIAQ
ncbi:mesoderm induction early response protein 1 isoform X1 [Patella vulgata]|uniref:mesoderm induction early response protein 1 isoform X1 n=2 Tax=Patella vulgata TaxID=6465 RepID=UPI00217FD843|nr:mesoderm induction early response protein 1 isoform X1 [Patella vulgata]